MHQAIGVQAIGSGPTAAVTNSMAQTKAPAKETAASRAETSEKIIVVTPFLSPPMGDASFNAGSVPNKNCLIKTMIDRIAWPNVLASFCQMLVYFPNLRQSGSPGKAARSGWRGVNERKNANAGAMSRS